MPDKNTADEKKTTKKNAETEAPTPEETAAEEKPKRSRKKAEPEAAALEAAALEAEEKPKRTRKKAEETAAEPADIVEQREQRARPHAAVRTAQVVGGGRVPDDASFVGLTQARAHETGDAASGFDPVVCHCATALAVVIKR